MRWFNPVVFCVTVVLAGSFFSTDASAILGAQACVSAVKASLRRRAAPGRAAPGLL
jgi:hypothetical protein